MGSHLQSEVGILSESEPLITLKELLDYLRERYGKEPSLSSAYRWVFKGVRGIRLETAMLGGSMVTNRSAADRFFQALQASRRERYVPRRSPAQNSRAAEAAGKKLEAMGI